MCYYLITMYYVYVLKSVRNATIYYGYTQDLRRRLWQHNHKKSVFTAKHGPFRLIYYEAYLSKVDAIKREMRLKEHGGAKHHLRKRIMHSNMSIRGKIRKKHELTDL